MIARVGKLAPKGKKSSGFIYKKRTTEQMKARAEQTGGRFDSYLVGNIDMFRPKNGDNLVRILPATWEDPEHYGFDVWMHSYVGPDSSTYLCLNKMLQKPCPICNAAREATEAGDKEEAKQLQPTRRVLMWIIDRDDETANHPIVWSMSWSQDRDIAALCHNKRTGKSLMIDHPEEGYDLSIKRTGTGLKTKYFGIAIDREPSPIADDERDQQEILDFIQENPIPDVLKYYDEEYLEKMITGEAEPKDEEVEGEGDEEPRGRAARPSSRGARGKEEVEERPRSRRPARDEEPEEEPEERPRSRTRTRDEEPEERPRGRTSSRRDEEPEEEVEEAPRSRRGRVGRDEEPEEDVEERPRSRTRARAEPEEEEPEERPRSRRASRDEEPEEEPEERPRTRRAARDEEPEERPRSRRARDEEPEEPEAEPEEPEEEPEEEERPRRRAGGRR